MPVNIASENPIYKLEDVKKFFHDKLGITKADARITELYNMISNPFVRVNSKDKQWVAFVTQASEDQTVLNAMKEILNLKDSDFEDMREVIIDEINKTGKTFVDANIKFKPRIPFYILVLDDLVKE